MFGYGPGLFPQLRLVRDFVPDLHDRLKLAALSFKNLIVPGLFALRRHLRDER